MRAQQCFTASLFEMFKNAGPQSSTVPVASVLESSNRSSIDSAALSSDDSASTSLSSSTPPSSADEGTADDKSSSAVDEALMQRIASLTTTAMDDSHSTHSDIWSPTSDEDEDDTLLHDNAPSPVPLPKPSGDVEGIPPDVEGPAQWDPETKLANLQKEFGILDYLNGPEAFVHDTYAALIRGVVIPGRMFLTSQRLAFYAVLPPLEDEAAAPGKSVRTLPIASLIR